MTFQEVIDKLRARKIPEHYLDSSLVAAFAKEMKNKQYGEEETWDAFVWFKEGWLARFSPRDRDGPNYES